MHQERLFQQIDSVETGRYSMTFEELMAVIHRHKGDTAEACADAFLYGFLKGQRAERAAVMEGHRREAATSAPGYGALLALVEKNQTSPQFVLRLLAFARGMSGRQREEANADR